MQPLITMIERLIKRCIAGFLFLGLVGTAGAQSPFMQENQSAHKTRKTIDTVQTNLTELVDRIDSKMKFIRNAVPNDLGSALLMANRQITDQRLHVDSLNADEATIALIRNNLAYQVETADNLVEKLRNGKGSAKEIIAQERLADSLKARIAVLDSSLKVMEVEKQKQRESLIDFQKRLDSAAYANSMLNAEKATLQQELFKSAVAENKELVEKFQKEVKRIEAALDSQVIGVNRTLSREDAVKAHDLHKKMYRQIADARVLVEKLAVSMDSLSKRFDNCQRSKDRMETILSLGNLETLKSVWDKGQKELHKAQVALTANFREIGDLLDDAKKRMATAGSSFNEYQEDLGRILKPYESEKTSNDGELKTLAGITQPLNEEGRLVPNISLLGYKGVSNETTNWSAQLKLFVGPSSSDKTKLSSAYKIFIPEASSYGFMADFSFGFIPSNKNYKVDENTRAPIKKLGFNLGAYYLVKDLFNPVDSTDFRTGMLQFKLGWQYVAIGKTLSLYANVNPYFFSDGIRPLKEHYPANDKLNAYIDFGVNAYLNPSPQLKANGFFIDFDLGFIVNAGDVKSITRTDDILLPRIKINLVKGFNF